MSDVSITELEEFDAKKVSGVSNPANGTPWLLIKARADEPAGVGNDDPGAGQTHSDEAAAIESEMTKAETDEAEKMSPGVPDYATATPTETGHVSSTGESGLVGPMTAGVMNPPPVLSEGGESPYQIPVEAHQAEAVDKDAWAFEVDDSAEKAGNWMEVDNDDADAPAAAEKEANLSNLLGEGAQKRATESEEDHIMALVTKEELDRQISEAAKAAVAEEGEKLYKKLKKLVKNANNGGDITAEQERGGVNGQHDADDIGVLSGAHNETPGVAKSEEEEVEKSEEDGDLEKLTKALENLTERVEKIASRPRVGGPVLDGMARGSFAAEGRMESEPVTKSAEDMKIEGLEKEHKELLKKSGVEAAAQASDMGAMITMLKLQRQHRREYGDN